jgi:hypothetical protein
LSAVKEHKYEKSARQVYEFEPASITQLSELCTFLQNTFVVMDYNLSLTLSMFLNEGTVSKWSADYSRRFGDH